MTVRYDAFISYSRADEAIAASLHKSLSRLMRRPLRRNYLRVFRDRTSLAPGSDLTKSLRDALDSSDWLVLLLSEASAGSAWVGEEIRHWLQRSTQAAERIVLLRCDDTVNLGWRADGTACGPETLPDALRSALRAEPFYIDVSERSTPSWADPAAVLLAAAILGREPADIASDDLRQHRRARRLATIGTALLAVLALGASTAGVIARNNAVRADHNAADAQRNAATAEANERRAVTFALMSQAEQWIDTRPGDALGLAITALERGNNTEAMGMIRRILGGLPPDMWFARIDQSVDDVEVSPSSEVVAVLSTQAAEPSTSATAGNPTVTAQLHFYSLDTFELIARSATFEVGPWPTMKFLGDGSLLLLSGAGGHHVRVEGNGAIMTEVSTANLPSNWLDIRLVEGSNELLILWMEEPEASQPTFARAHLDQVEVTGNELRLVDGLSTEPLESVEFGTISSHGLHFVVGRGFKLALTDPWARVYQVPDMGAEASAPWVEFSPGIRPIGANALDRFCWAGEGLPDKPCGLVDVLLNGEAFELGDRTGRQEHVSVDDLEVSSDSVLSDPELVREGFICNGIGYLTDAGLTMGSDVGMDRYEVPATIDDANGLSFEAFDVACSPDGRWVMATSSGLVRVGRGGRSTISGTSSALQVSFDGPGVADGSIGTPGDISLRRGVDGGLELVADGTVLARAGLPGSGAIAPDQELVPLATTTEWEITEGLHWNSLEYYQSPTFPDAGALVTIDDLSDPSAPRRVLDVAMFGNQIARAMFMSDGALLGYVGSVHGDFIVPTLFLFGDEEILGLACGVGAQVPADLAEELSVPAGIPSSCGGHGS